MKRIFKTKSNELRALWKLIILSIFVSVFLVISAIMMENYSIKDEYGLLVFTSFILGTLLSLYIVDRKKLKDLGFTNLKKGITDIFIGLLLGGLLVVLNVFILYMIGDLSFITKLSSPNIDKFLMDGFLVFIVVAIAEEMLFRGYIMLSMRHMKMTWLAIIVSALIFALLHGALNDAVSILAVINLFLAGVMLSYMLYKSEGLYLPIGAHITWNYFQGFVFGVNVSGQNVGKAMYIAKMEDNIFTGDKFGLEGGLVNTFVMVLAIIIVFLMYKNANQTDR